MHYRLIKFCRGISYLSAATLTVLWMRGLTDWRLTTGCIIVSTFWLLISVTDLKHLMRNYFDVLSRLGVMVPLCIGAALAVLALGVSGGGKGSIFAFADIAGWAGVYLAYRHNRLKFEQAGHGPLPDGAWVNPPAAGLQPGDLILTGGRVADTLHESVGHAETVLKAPDGSLWLFSSYMDRGCVMDPVATIAAEDVYIVLRQTVPLSEEKLALEYQIAQIMIEQSHDWAVGAQAVRARRFHALRFVLPMAVQNFINKKLPITGYDWIALYSGRIAPDHWICITSCLELFHRIGVKTMHYGVGLLGMGTGLFDPIEPVRALDDPAFHMLTVTDQAHFEALWSRG